MAEAAKCKEHCLYIIADPADKDGVAWKNCRKVISNPADSPYCYLHRCKYTDADGERCKDVIYKSDVPKRGAYLYCKGHCCSGQVNGARCKGLTAPGSILCAHCQPKPAAAGDAEEQVVCLQCMDSFTPAEGIFCKADAKHFTCSDCFGAHVEDKSKEENRLALQASGLLVYCIDTHCRAQHPHQELAFTLTEIAAHASINPAGLIKYIQARESCAAAVAQEEMQERFERLAVDRTLAIQQRILNSALLIRTPCCNTAWDWPQNDCAAITCSQCKPNISFCGLCLLNCGPNASNLCHAHLVNECRLQQEEGVFASEETREAAHREVRKQQVERALEAGGADLDNPLLRAAVLRPLETHLRDLGISLETFHVYPAAGEGMPSPEALRRYINEGPLHRRPLSELYAHYHSYLSHGREAQHAFIGVLLSVGRVYLVVEEERVTPRSYVVLKNREAGEHRAGRGGRGGRGDRGRDHAHAYGRGQGRG